MKIIGRITVEMITEIYMKVSVFDPFNVLYVKRRSILAKHGYYNNVLPFTDWLNLLKQNELNTLYNDLNTMMNENSK